VGRSGRAQESNQEIFHLSFSFAIFHLELFRFPLNAWQDVAENGNEK
jgi:hypothetical protein